MESCCGSRPRTSKYRCADLKKRAHAACRVSSQVFPRARPPACGFRRRITLSFGPRAGSGEMRFLELRIPPPVVGLIVAGGMWAVAHLAPTLPLPNLARLLVAGVLCVTGIAVAIGGVLSFRRARTTVNPLKPELSAALVTTGVYTFTRNPMYLGMMLGLYAWAAYLSSIWSLAGPILFAVYITRFQIVPEERVLAGLFGAAFTAYKTRVRRWL
jgi:protein-S-isoprenylcysteine O-methyltransferase Ste14